MSQADGVAQVFSFITQQTFNVYASTWMRMPPDVLDNPYSALVAFYVPRFLLERQLKLFLLVKDETKPTAHSMPDEVCGFTDQLDDLLRKVLM
jgi:hypothetical protein